MPRVFLLLGMLLTACGSPENANWRPSDRERQGRAAFIQSHPEFPRELVEQLRRFEAEPQDALRRYQYLASQRRLPHALRRLILYGVVRVGMHEDHVRAAVGEPTSVTPRGKDSERWTYPVPSRSGTLREMEVVLRNRLVIGVTLL